MLTKLSSGHDLRQLNNRDVIEAVRNQQSFDDLFILLFHHERSVVMRAVDAVEKITLKYPEFLIRHKDQLLHVLKGAIHKELKWHAAQLISRIDLDKNELADVWHLLIYWCLNKNESKIVRVNSLQALFDISKKHIELKNEYEKTLETLSHESIPSLQARIRKLSKESIKLR